MCIVCIGSCSDSSVIRDAMDRGQDSVREQWVSFRMGTGHPQYDVPLCRMDVNDERMVVFPRVSRCWGVHQNRWFWWIIQGPITLAVLVS